MLPFKHKKNVEERLVKDGLGNSLSVPFYGCLTPNEKIDLVNARLTLPTEAGMSQAKFELACVSQFLSRRFNQEVSVYDLAEEAGSFQMIHALYEFLEGEDRAWESPSVMMELSGEDALELATEYSLRFETAVVASRPDLRIAGRYFVFRDRNLVPSDYEVEGDRGKQSSEKSSREHLSRNNSQKSIGNSGEDSQESNNSMRRTSETVH